MADFKRETFEKKSITADKLSIPGKVSKNQGTIAQYAVVALDKTSGEWVKYASETHKTGHALGILKDETVTSATEGTAAAILIQGIVSPELLTADNELKTALLIQGIAIL